MSLTRATLGYWAVLSLTLAQKVREQLSFTWRLHSDLYRGLLGTSTSA